MLTMTTTSMFGLPSFDIFNSRRTFEGVTMVTQTCYDHSVIHFGSTLESIEPSVN